LCPLEPGERIFEYKGEVIAWRKAVRRSRRTGQAGHTFLFGLSDGRVIDGEHGGNSARWLNHACEANCEAIECEGRVFIEATKSIRAGDELFISYELNVDEPLTDEICAQYVCRCGSAQCAGTMLAATLQGSLTAHRGVDRRAAPAESQTAPVCG
jgi:hypothetical protein